MRLGLLRVKVQYNDRARRSRRWTATWLRFGTLCDLITKWPTIGVLALSQVVESRREAPHVHPWRSRGEGLLRFSTGCDVEN